MSFWKCRGRSCPAKRPSARNDTPGDGGAKTKDAPSLLDLRDIQALSCCSASSRALDKFGNLYVWGVGIGIDDYDSPHKFMENVIHITSGIQHSIVMTKNRGLIGWGENSYNELGIPGVHRTEPLPIKQIPGVLLTTEEKQTILLLLGLSVRKSSGASVQPSK